MTGPSESKETQENQKSTALNSQVGGNHYLNLAIQPAEYAEFNNMPPLIAETLKYITRFEWKGGEQDLNKAIHCLELYKELRYEHHPLRHRDDWIIEARRKHTEGAAGDNGAVRDQNK